MKAAKVCLPILLSVFLLLCSCERNQLPVDQIPNEKLTVSEANIANDDDSQLFSGCSINVIKEEQNAQGETIYVSRFGEPFVYEGGLITTTLSVGGYSSFPANAKVFVLLDGQLCTIISDDGEQTLFSQCSFEPVSYGDEIFDNTINIPLSFEPVICETKESYDLTFCVYLYNPNRSGVSKNVLQSELDSYISFCSITYEMYISNGFTAMLTEKNAMSAPDNWHSYNTDDTKSESLIKLSTSSDPNEYLGCYYTMSKQDSLYLFAYFKEASQYQIMLFVDGVYYNASDLIGCLCYDASEKSDSAACFDIPIEDLEYGCHTIDVIVLDMCSNDLSFATGYMICIE